MQHIADTASYLTGLRERATIQLAHGIRSDLSRSSTSEAMAVLFQLASSPSTAGDALALLHELQVHQVEVDMQYEELHHSRAELESKMVRQKDLVECAPAGLLVVDDATVLCEINSAGVRLLGAAGDDILGRTLTSFLSAASGEQLHKMIAQARSDVFPDACELLLLSQGGVPRKLLCTVGRQASSGRFVLVILALAQPS